jgi:hypothetical protein
MEILQGQRPLIYNGTADLVRPVTRLRPLGVAKGQA